MEGLPQGQSGFNVILNPDHLIYKAHFPGQPVTPGVCILQMIQEKKLTEFDRRAAMRYCTSFKRVDEIQPVLDFLEDYGYIFQQPVMTKANTGRPPLPRYTVNPKVHQMFCHSVGDSSGVLSGPS